MLSTGRFEKSLAVARAHRHLYQMLSRIPFRRAFVPPLLIAALYDLTRPGRRVRGDNKVIWALIIIFVSMIGPILYFLAGREEA